MLLMSLGRDERRRAALAMVAPGTALRDGLERIVRGNTGALIVLGFDPVVGEICSGGFKLDAEFSATRLRELAKMDGAVVLDQAGTRILRAAVQLVPDPRLPTQESGTRHRTAERVARQTGYPVITVSKSMRTIAVFIASDRYVLEDSAALLTRAHQALSTLERYKRRLDDAASALSALEIEDRATVGDLAVVAQRLEMVRRVTDEIGGYLVELGTDGGLLGLQLDELTAGTARERDMLLRDYAPERRMARDGAAESPDESTAGVVAAGLTDAAAGASAVADTSTAAGASPVAGTSVAAGTSREGAGGAYSPGTSVAAGTSREGAGGADSPGTDLLAALGADELLDLAAVAAAVGLDTAGDLGQHVTSRGYRLLGQIPRLPAEIADDLIEHFGGLQKLLSASAQDLRRVAGVDPALATSVREGLSRLAESALVERYS
jgi:DNA integrity scanning protein DisA with diadenylate cyclase activity